VKDWKLAKHEGCNMGSSFALMTVVCPIRASFVHDVKRVNYISHGCASLVGWIMVMEE